MTPAAFAALTPADFERVVAGALWREERWSDRLALLLVPHLREGVGVRDLPLMDGRQIGETRVPGYRREPTDG